ncbi:hypothetical protein SEA_CLUBPENGUIN_71 [Streptomyces phage ClubPenguin]|nr:hypothetical protein SEA_CLUBPENGUIN_71 [Streptomyces phage ClubPenguin]
MSKRVHLLADMGSTNVAVGWMEVTPTGRILEVHFLDPVAKVSTGGSHIDTRCTSCAQDVCIRDLVTPGADECLCCKSNHGQVDPNVVQTKT